MVWRHNVISKIGQVSKKKKTKTKTKKTTTTLTTKNPHANQRVSLFAKETKFKETHAAAATGKNRNISQ